GLRHLLLKGTGEVLEDGSVVELLRAAALELQRRYWDRMLRLPDVKPGGLLEAPADLFASLSKRLTETQVSSVVQQFSMDERLVILGERLELIQLSCRAIAKDIHDLPPIYLTKSFFGAVALDLVASRASEDAAQSALLPPAGGGKIAASNMTLMRMALCDGDDDAGDDDAGHDAEDDADDNYEEEEDDDDDCDDDVGDCDEAPCSRNSTLSYPFEAALVEALSLMAYHMLLIIPRGLRVEMEMMAQLLLALAVRAPEAKLELLGFSSLIRVQQRELVRKAIQLGSGFSRCAAFAAAAVWPWREEWLQPWFLEEVRHFGEREAVEVTAGLSDWLDAAVSAQEPTPQGAPVARDFGVGVVPWPSAVAWYLPPCQTERNESPLLRTYGPETRVMGWELGMDSMEQDADFAQE
ncbi:unnamed protein product, partial [Symbiodinium sp. KB8]